MTELTPEKSVELRKAFPAGKVGKLPRITCAACSKKQCTEHQKKACAACGNYITTKHIHLDYVGHAEVTRRLLDVDPEWSWEPVAFGPDGAPLVDKDGGMWIKLTVCGVTRWGYGDAGSKRGGDATKEVIGDAIRNAAMRFGVALDLWSKEKDSYIETEGSTPEPAPVKTHAEWLAMITCATTNEELIAAGQGIAKADLPADQHAELRAEYTKRVHELKGTDK